jgi:hypothetical protein
MRVPAWESRLAALVGAARARPFRYGVFDCCLWACDAIAALTGEDPGRPYRGAYSTAAEAEAVLVRDGGVRGIAETIARARGFAPTPAPLARRGDIVLARIRERDMLGVCLGAKAAFARLPEGLAFLRMRSPLILTCWRID